MVDYTPIIDFWVNEIGPKGWYNGPPDLDAIIRARFMADWEKADAGGFADWADTPNGCLAYLILTDQFPRNMFRDDARAFATDTKAYNVAKRAIERNFDRKITGRERQFFYMPFEHSEDIADQARSVHFMEQRMIDGDDVLHARAHQEIIRQFGRFPYRNKALGRVNSKEEQVFLDGNGYQGILKMLQNKSPAS